MKMNYFPSWALSCFVCLGLVLAGCSTPVGNKVVVSTANVSKYDALSSNDAVVALGKRIEEARAANMSFFAPSYFREASEILNEAQKTVADAPKAELVSKVSKADAILDKGMVTLETVKTRLASELEQKNHLDRLGSMKTFPGEYEDTISDLSGLIKKIEQEKANDIEKDRQALLKDMQGLVIKTVQFNTLHESDLINEDTQDKDAEKLAPVTFAEALRVYQDAMGRIALNPHDEATVKLAGKDALFAANHARHVTARVTALQKQLKESVESIVVDEEKRLLDISSAMGHSDPRDQPVEKQAESLAQTGKELYLVQQKTGQSIAAINEDRNIIELRLKEANNLITQKNIQIEMLNDQLAALKQPPQAIAPAAGE